MATPLLLPDHAPVSSDLKNPAATAHQGDFLSRRLFNLSRHTVGFRAVISLLAVFDLDLHEGNLPHFAISAKENSRDSSENLF
jgi:hypothetical protein